jgi:hypothetical protein
MNTLQHTTRFGFPALRLGSFYAVLLRKWKFGVHCPRSVETGYGVGNLVAINIGRLMLLYDPTVSCQYEDRPQGTHWQRLQAA